MDVARLKESSPDWKVLLFTLAICAIRARSVVLSWPSRISGLIRAKMLKQGKSAAGSLRRQPVHSLLVVTELMFALVLLTGAGLMLQGLWLIHSPTAAFAPDRVLTTSLNVRETPAPVRNSI
jgi:hypothetical protein